jgi:hypothetical protein
MHQNGRIVALFGKTGLQVVVFATYTFMDSASNDAFRQAGPDCGPSLTTSLYTVSIQWIRLLSDLLSSAGRAGGRYLNLGVSVARASQSPKGRVARSFCSKAVKPRGVRDAHSTTLSTFKSLVREHVFNRRPGFRHCRLVVLP